MERNKLYEKVLATSDYDEIRKVFIESALTDTLIRRLRVLLRLIEKPLAIRSSGLFETLSPNRLPEYSKLTSCQITIRISMYGSGR
jgi:hypothetical protein